MIDLWNMRRILLFGASIILAACGAGKSEQPIFHANENPDSLRAWNVLKVDQNALHLTERVTPYDLNTPLFSDYAHKLRTVWVPEGETAHFQPTETFDFPVGTIISKTFYYPRSTGGQLSDNTVLRRADKTAQFLNASFDLNSVRLVETRLLVHRKDGWAALPYVWNEEQTDAVLKRTGDIQSLKLVGDDGKAEPFAYVVPNANQCAGCHATNATTRKVRPIGPKARHLNKTYPYGGGVENQLSAWQTKGLLGEIPALAKVEKNALWGSAELSLEKRARSYLDINCSHCHNKVGPADTSGLLLEPDAPHGASLGLCKLPIAAGTGTGNRKFDIVPAKPEESIFIYRMASTNPAVMMPELGRTTRHDEGVALIAEWIGEMKGACE